jgi:5,10-methylenetetrahydromethanopterin reductase
MRIGIMLGDETQLLSQPPEVSRRPPDLEALVREAQQMEARSFASAWLVNIFEFDAIGTSAIIGRETQRIEVGTAVVPTFPRHPVAMAQQALTAQAAARGRFTLGIGLSHRLMMEDMFGLSWDKPARHLREYLAVLTPLLEGQPATFHGEHYRVNAALHVPGVAPVPLLIAALGPVMLGLAGRFADGTITWMTGPRTLETHIGPRIRKAANEAGRREPRIVAGFPIAITNTPARAREVAGQVFAIYGTLPSYQAMLAREGVAGPADNALVGDTAALEAELRRLAAVGVTDLLAVPFAADAAAVERTIEFLAGQL